MRRALVALLAIAPAAGAQRVDSTYEMHNFRFASGQTMLELRIAYTTLGAPRKDAAGVVRNAVLMLHGTTGTGSGLVGPMSPLFAPGQPLDTTRHFVVFVDGIGHGRSSKPSDGLKMRFPKYTYDDMVDAQKRLLTERLGVTHLKLVMGTSMGCMHAWVWGTRYPNFADALVPLACAPTAIAGRNRMIRQLIIDAITSDPDWRNGDYTEKPMRGMRAAMGNLFIMTSAPLVQQRQAPTKAAADSAIRAYTERQARALDPNDVIYAFEASRDYDPSSKLDTVDVPVLAINSADDFVNPPELGFMEKLMPRVQNGRYILIPTSEETRGHGTHSRPQVWGTYVAEFLAKLDGKALLLDPKNPEWTKPAPAISQLEFETTKGAFVLELVRANAPIGADRLYNLVRLGYYDDTRFHRVNKAYIAQFGLHGDPAVNAAWKDMYLSDDPGPPGSHNERGTFAFSYKGPGNPNTRKTQIYVNLADNARSDGEPFRILGRVVSGLEVLDSLYSGYGENSGSGVRQGRQGPLEAGGNAYMDKEFPLLDRIIRASVVRVQVR